MFVAVVAISHLAGLISSIDAIINTRTSQGSIAWAISLNTIPYIAVPAYWILGRSRFQGYITSKKEIASKIDGFSEQALKIVEEYEIPESVKTQATRSAENLTQLKMLSGNRVQLLIDGRATFHSIFEGINTAQKYILVQFYIIRDDRIGRELKNRLIKKVAQGVNVYLLYDEIGSAELPASYINDLRNAGVSVNAFNTRKGPRNNFQINFRNHRKNVIVDGKSAWIGGHNVGDEYLGRDPKIGPWRDTHMRLDGPSVLQAQYAFVQDWQWATGNVLDLSWEPSKTNEGTANVLVMPSGPADELETANLMFVGAIHAAKERIWIASPYFIPDEAVITALQMAGLRGVDVRILIPEKADHILVYLAAFSFFSKVSQTGVKIYKYKPGFLHEKVVLVDDKVAIVGTANFDNRSFRLNFEISVLVNDRVFHQNIEEMFEEDFKQAREIGAREYEDQTAWFRFKVRFANLFSTVL